MEKWTVKLVRESYVEIEAENYDEVDDTVMREGISEEQIEENAGEWDVHEIKKSDEY